MSKLMIPEVERLSVADKLQLIDQLWSDVAAHADEIPVPEWHRRILAERHQEFLKNPEAGEPWEVVRDRIRRQL
jgi:putative addiction module component (TIGR02574 family)